eukprot:scaffold2917_cov191-Amphora_coffeaeformis.AAC.43
MSARTFRCRRHISHHQQQRNNSERLSGMIPYQPDWHPTIQYQAKFFLISKGIKQSMEMKSI